MQRFTTPRLLATAGIVLGALGAVSAAHARSDIYFSIGVQPAPYYYAQPAPVYVQPAPVYVQPYYGHNYHPRYRHQRRYGPNGDLDRDGIPNQYDRDMDGDGVRNWRDRAPGNGWRY